MVHDRVQHVAAIIVTYNSPNSFKEVVRTIHQQVETIIIIDNSSSPPTIAMLHELKKEFPLLDIIFNRSNQGLAAAQNRGIEKALQQNIPWILLLDDDSIPADNMVKELLNVANSTSSKNVIFTPQILDKQSGSPHKVVCKGGFLGLSVKIATEVTSLYIALSSGMLIESAHLKEIGAMKEALFIDEIDTEFCLRTLLTGKQIMIAPKAHLFHQIGTTSTYTIGTKKVTTWNHSALRKFYIFRNRIWLWKNYWSKTPRFIFYEIGSTIRLLILIILFENQKIEKCKAITKGIWEGLWM